MLPVLAFVAGLAATAYGLWLAWPPLAFIVPGLIVALWGLFYDQRPKGKR